MLVDAPAGAGDVAALEQARQRVGAGDEDLGVAFEHVEEAVLLRHDGADESEHPVPPGESVDAHNDERGARIEHLFARAKRQNYYAELGLLDRVGGLGRPKTSARSRSPRSGQSSAWRVTSSG